VILHGVACFLTFMIDLVLFEVGLKDVVGGHADGLGEGDQKVKKIDDLDPDILLVEFLVFGPPFPRDAIDQLGHLLAHGAGVVENPLGFLFFGQILEFDADAFVEDGLETENFFEFIGCCHEGEIAL